jgi:hypothetical protein
MQWDDQVNEKPISYMSQSLLDDEFKYSYIEKHAFALVKAVEKFHHFILDKHRLVKVPLPAIKFLLSQTYLSGKLAHWLAKIQEHDLTITTSKTIKGRDLALHFILDKQRLVKVPLPAIKCLLSQTYLSGKLANWLAKIQEHDLTITTSKTIKGRDLALHLAQHAEASEEFDEQDGSLSALFYIDNQILLVVEHLWYKDVVYYLQN